MAEKDLDGGGGAGAGAGPGGETLEELEQQFNEVLAGLSGDATLEAFRAQYEQVYAALKRSHEGERRLAKKLRETNQEIVQNAARVQQALKLSEEDAATIDELKKQIERAWGMVEQANAREEQATSAIERLQAEIGQLSAVVQRHANLLGGDMTIEELISTRDSLAIQLREASASAAYEKERAQTLAADLDSRTEKFREKKAQVKELERVVAQKTAEETKESKKRATVEAEVKRLKGEITEHMGSLGKQAKAIADADLAKARLAHSLEQAHTAHQQLAAEMHALQATRLQLEGEGELLRGKQAELQEARLKQDAEAKGLRVELQRERAAGGKLQSKLDLAEREHAELVKQLALAEEAAAELRVDKKDAEKELTKEMLRSKEVEAAGAKLGREKTAAEKKVAAEQQRVKEERDAAAALKSGGAILEGELRRMRIDAAKNASLFAVCDRERERALGQVEALEKALAEKEEELRLRDTQIGEMDRKELELHAKIKQATSQFEAMRAERNAVAKQLAAGMDEISEVRRKSKVQGNQIEQLKEDIHSKDKGLVAEQFESAALSKKLEVRNHEVEQLRRLLDDASDNVLKSEGEIVELNKALRRLDGEALAQKRSYDQVVCERDINQAQLVRRNDEISLLYERIAVMTTMLSTGEVAYRARLDDMKLLKLKLADVHRELNLAKDERAGGNKDALRAECVRLQRELLAEQSRVKALSEELSNPVNVHRWRKLEGTDPASYDLVQKAQVLQRRLIAKTEAVVERDLQLAEREREVAALREQVNGAPGPEVVEQLAAVRIALNDRTRELKAVASEVNMAQAQVAEFKFEADRAARELVDVKAQLFATQRRAAAGGGAAARPESGGGGGGGGSGGDGTGGTAAGAGAGVARAGAAKEGSGGGSDFEVSQRRKQQALQAGTGRTVFVGGGFNVHAA
jgi:chromosome segregation ATPase